MEARRSYPLSAVPSRVKGTPTTKLLAVPPSTVILASANSKGNSVNTILTSKGPVTLASSKALTTAWLPGRNRWIETTFGRFRFAAAPFDDRNYASVRRQLGLNDGNTPLASTAVRSFVVSSATDTTTLATVAITITCLRCIVTTKSRAVAVAT